LQARIAEQSVGPLDLVAEQPAAAEAPAHVGQRQSGSGDARGDRLEQRRPAARMDVR